MKFLLDENVPNSFKNKLKENGFSNIKRINDFGKGLPDNKVFDISIQEERTIISIDKDFYAYKKVDNCGIISLSGRLREPISKLKQVVEQIQLDQRFPMEDYRNMFIRITNEDFKIVYKKKNKYKEITCKYKNI